MASEPRNLSEKGRIALKVFLRESVLRGEDREEAVAAAAEESGLAESYIGHILLYSPAADEDARTALLRELFEDAEDDVADALQRAEEAQARDQPSRPVVERSDTPTHALNALLRGFVGRAIPALGILEVLDTADDVSLLVETGAGRNWVSGSEFLKLLGQAALSHQ